MPLVLQSVWSGCQAAGYRTPTCIVCKTLNAVIPGLEAALPCIINQIPHFCSQPSLAGQSFKLLLSQQAGSCGLLMAMAVQDAPFFTVKLQVKVLPCLVLFINGKAVDRTVGFDEFGARDDFPVSAIERRLLTSMVIVKRQPTANDSDPEDLPEHRRRAIKQSVVRSASDEDSDFE